MSPYRDDLEAVRRRADALEAEVASRDGALRECEAELAQCRAELARAREEGPRGGALPLALVAFVGALGSIVLTAPVDGPHCRGERAAQTAWLEGAPAAQLEGAPAAQAAWLEGAPAAAMAPATRAFDHAIAETLLRAKARQATTCERPGGPSGEGRAVLTFAGDGVVDSLAVFGEAAVDPSTRACLEAVYRATQVPPFLGVPVTVSGQFYLRPWELDLTE